MELQQQKKEQVKECFAKQRIHTMLSLQKLLLNNNNNILKKEDIEKCIQILKETDQIIESKIYECIPIMIKETNENGEEKQNQCYVLKFIMDKNIHHSSPSTSISTSTSTFTSTSTPIISTSSIHTPIINTKTTSTTTSTTPITPIISNINLKSLNNIKNTTVSNIKKDINSNNKISNIVTSSNSNRPKFKPPSITDPNKFAGSVRLSQTSFINNTSFSSPSTEPGLSSSASPSFFPSSSSSSIDKSILTTKRKLNEISGPNYHSNDNKRRKITTTTIPSNDIHNEDIDSNINYHSKTIAELEQDYNSLKIKEDNLLQEIQTIETQLRDISLQIHHPDSEQQKPKRVIVKDYKNEQARLNELEYLALKWKEASQLVIQTLANERDVSIPMIAHVWNISLDRLGWDEENQTFTG